VIGGKYRNKSFACQEKSPPALKKRRVEHVCAGENGSARKPPETGLQTIRALLRQIRPGMNKMHVIWGVAMKAGRHSYAY